MNKYLSLPILLVKLAFFVFIIFIILFVFNRQNFNVSNLFRASLTSEITQLPLNESVLPDAPPPEDLQNSQIKEVIVQNLVTINLNDKQNEIDEILEKIDILKQQIAELQPDSDSGINPDLNDSVQLNDEEKEINQDIRPDQPLYNPPDVPRVNVLVNSGGSSNPIYPKILISEVQVAGFSDKKDEFVELYNPNAGEIDLTGWYLQKKTKNGSGYSTYVPNNLFSDKKIPANGYFVISRESFFFAGSPDIIAENSLAEDNSLILKNPNGGISDLLGFGEVQEYEANPVQNPKIGKSIGRKWDTLSNIEQDTGDNSADFEHQNSTPKAKNITFIAPDDLPLPILADAKAPEAVFDIISIQNSLNFTINFTLVDPINMVSQSGIDGYIFRWQEEGNGWQEDVFVKVDGSPNSVTLNKNFTGQDEKTYYFQVKTKDILLNESNWQPEIPAETKITIPKKVLINEIQIEGKTVKDEFIELYNPNAIDIDLSGFSLKKKTFSDDNMEGTQSNLVSSSAFFGVIPALSYFLIAPQDNDDSTKNYTGQEPPDLRYSGTSFSFAPDNAILLYGKDDTLLDKVGFGNAGDFETMPALNHPELKSIGRVKNANTGQFDDTDNNALDFQIQKPDPRNGNNSDDADIAAPLRSNGLPNRELPSGTIQVDISVATSEIAICKHSTAIDQDYNELSNIFLTQDGLAHTATINGLVGGNTYTYYIRCVDELGNKNTDDFIIAFSIALPEPPAPETFVVINEIAWMGSEVSTSNEWIELFNPGDQAIDLSGWKLTWDDSKSVIDFEKLIDAHGFYLLERTDDDSVADIAADQIYTGPLKNNGEHLYLYDAFGNLKDEVDCSAGWFAGSNDEKQTMQRKDYLFSGNDAQNWQTSDLPGGTPKSL